MGSVPLPLTRPVTLTGVGSVPGTAVRDWATRISDQLPDLPHVPELPERGPGADMIGRTLGLLSEVAPEFSASTTVTGWELAAASRDMRRARSLLGEDLDAVELAWSGHKGLAKQQVAGPYTLAATVEFRGRRLIADQGLVRDLIAAWEEMVAQHRAALSRRLPAQWLVQMDEPLLPAVAAGRVRTVSDFSVYPAMHVELPRGADLLHCCARDLPWGVLHGIAGLSLDYTLHRIADDESLAQLSTGGTTIAFGVSQGAGSVRSVMEFFDRTGLSPAPLVLTPPCGMVSDYRPWQRISDDLSERLS